jgi:hypothetical protein
LVVRSFISFASLSHPQLIGNFVAVTVTKSRELLLLSILIERGPEHVKRDGYQPGVLGLDVHEIGHADPDHGALTSRLRRFSEKPGLDHVIGALLPRRRNVRRPGVRAKRTK